VIFFQKETKISISVCIFLVSCLALLTATFPTQSEAADTLLENVLTKIQTNQDKIETIKMNIVVKINGNTSEINSIQTMSYLLKRGENPKAKIVFSSGRTAIICVDTKTVSGMDEGKIWPEPRFLFRIKEYLEDPDVGIANQENDVCVLTSKVKNSPEEFPKIEWYINQNAGMIKKVLIYDATGNLCQKIEVKEYQLINNTIWFPKKITHTITTLLNKIQKEITYKNVEINIEIPDEEFIDTQGE